MAQKGLIDANVERTLKKFAASKKQSAAARTENKAVGWFRPVVGRLVKVNFDAVKNIVGQGPPSTTFQVFITSKDSGERCVANVTTDAEGRIIGIDIPLNSQGDRFVANESPLLMVPVDTEIAADWNQRGIDKVPIGAAEVTWEGSLQTEADLIAIHTAFETQIAEERLMSTYDVSDPGNSSDGILLPLQIDYMAQAERAYRSRATHTFPRTLAHVASREKGHSQPTGVFLGQALDYFILLLKQGASAEGGDV
jgi:hypothetical protein